MQFALQPLPLLVLVLGFGVVIAIIQAVQNRHNPKDPRFGFATLSLVAFLSAISFLTGFSLGWVLSIITTFLSLCFATISKQYRLQIFICGVISSLLALFMRGYFVYAREILQGLLVILVFISAYRVINTIRLSNRRGIGVAIHGVAACLSALGLLIPIPVSGWITALAIGSGIAGILLTKQYRLYLVLIGVSGYLWLMNIILQ